MIPDLDAGGPPGGRRARDAAAAVLAGAVTAAALREDALRRVERWEPWLGAVVALASDPPPTAPAGLLAGVVAGVKDLLWVRGLPRTCGAPGLTDPRPADTDAAAVARLRDAGATIACTLQTHQFGYGILTPQTRNPRAPHRVAGGSSGGSAAAVAAGIVHVAIGTDTGGSVRIPAACCGVVGLKPTYGAVPVDGVQPLAPSLDTVGALAGDVEDLAAACAVLLGRELDGSLPTSLRVGVPRQTEAQRLDPQVRAAWRDTVERLRRAGARVDTVDLPTLPDAPRANGLLLSIEALHTHRELPATRPDGLWPDGLWADVRERLEAARAHGAAEREWASAVRARLREESARALDDVDVLLTPTLPCRVPGVGAETVDVDGQARPVTPTMTRLTNPWNLLGAPAGSVPVTRDSDGAPVGMQVVGGWDQEAQVLSAMRLLEEVWGGPWPVATPPAAA